MPDHHRCLWAVVAAALLCPTLTRAAEDEIWNERITSAWLDDHLAVRSTAAVRRTYALTRTQVWTSGLGRSPMMGFAPTQWDRTVGARLRPVQDLPLSVGTEITRAGEGTGSLSSRVTWETSWSRKVERLGGLRIGLTAGGSLARRNAALSQSVSGTLGIPLAMPLRTWTMEVRVSPSMSLDAAAGTLGTHLASEIVSRRVLGSPAGALRSVLGVKVGYGVAPDARPTAFAGLELRISPNL